MASKVIKAYGRRRVPIEDVRATTRARQILNAREQRCTADARAQVEREIVSPSQRFTEAIVDLIKITAGKGTVKEALRKPDSANLEYMTTRDYTHGRRYAAAFLYDEMRRQYLIAYAARNRDGSVSWDACDSPTTEAFSARCSPTRGLESNAYPSQTRAAWDSWRKARNQARVRPCACTQAEEVAVDALLERGDRRAAKLAKMCRRGGDMFEGAKGGKR